jgi:hypothetical protein
MTSAGSGFRELIIKLKQNKMNMNQKVFIGYLLFILLANPVYAQDTAGKSIRKGNVGGYMITRVEKVDVSYNAGYSMYAAAWPLVKEYPGRRFQSGLFGTWMHPQHDGPLPVEKLYTDIEGTIQSMPQKHQNLSWVGSSGTLSDGPTVPVPDKGETGANQKENMAWRS